MPLCQKRVELGNGTSTYCMKQEGHEGDCDKFPDGIIPSLKIKQPKKEEEK